jgi:23S rRNA (cytidine2498-2'-O)-methyltransferase
LVEELSENGHQARVISAGLVESERRPRAHPTFARLGFPVEWVGSADEAAARVLAHHWKGAIWLQAWVPDSDLGNRFSREATRLGGQVLAERRAAGLPVYERVQEARAAKVELAQLVVLGATAIAGTLPASAGDYDSAGGRTRVRRHKESPSRAAMKLEEALRWKGNHPGPGATCVDLGAAPGGWTERLLALGARVIAVDPGKLRPDLMRAKGVRHIEASAFDFAPEVPVDWLFCDMAWRPLEVAQLLAKWARNGWARQLVSNIKLPMKDKLPAVQRVRETLEAGGWSELETRQLYHDRDEITVIARRV